MNGRALEFLPAAEHNEAIIEDLSRRMIFITGGDSQMKGIGDISEVSSFNTDRVLNFNLARNIVRAADPIMDPTSAYDTDLVGGNTAGGSCLVSFGSDIAAAFPARSVLLVPCAHGGSSFGNWLGGNIASLAIDRARSALAEGGVLGGVLWYIGGVDAQASTSASSWEANFNRLRANMNGSLGVPDLPWVFSVLVDSPPDPAVYPFWAEVRSMQANMPLQTNVARIDASSLPLKTDNTHMTSASEEAFGHRYSAAILPLLGG